MSLLTPPSNDFDYITDKIAIGNCNSSYEPFDVIVNLCYPQNGVAHREIQRVRLNYTNRNSKILIKIGILDLPTENMESLLSKIIPYLCHLHKENPNLRILFHCFAGVSRSSTVAIAYLMHVYNISFQNAYFIAKEHRPIIQPNEGFLNVLERLK